ncbi:efflux RND transporter periplasmic adaptor subunit [Phocaeicola faecalis]
MKCRKLSIVAVSVVLFCSCGQQPAQERGPRPVKLAEVALLNKIEKSYSGVVSPDQFSDLAFKMSGPLVAMNVLEGQRVKKGDVVAEIDPTDYKLDYDAKRASFQKAASQMQRAEKLLMKNAISMQEFETTQASYTNAKSAFENAQNTLNDTKLRAPFDGFIQRKYVENYQRVQPGQGVVCLVNPTKLQVEFTIPETNIAYVTSHGSIFVEFDAYKGKLFQAKVKEYVEASQDGAGVPVFLYIDDPEFDLKKYQVSVGFSCRVVVNIENETVKEGITVPLSAVVFDNTLNNKIVFIYNPSTQKVEKRKIYDEGTIVGRNDLIVSGEVKAGEQVVAAGASYLVDGQQVKILTE